MRLLRYFIIALITLMFWQAIILIFALPDYLLPGPVTVLKTLIRERNLILHNTWPTLIEIIMGLFLGVLAGIWAALCLSYFHWARFWFLPVLLISQAIPTFAVAPLLVIWFGYGMSSKIAVTILMIFFPVVSAFYDGLRQTPLEWLNLAKVMGASRWRLLTRIRIPAALPALGTGLRVAATFAPMGAVIGEWVGSSGGLGFLMLNANARMQIDLMFATLMVLVGVTLILYFSVDRLLNRFIFWRNDV